MPSEEVQPIKQDLSNAAGVATASTINKNGESVALSSPPQSTASHKKDENSGRNSSSSNNNNNTENDEGVEVVLGDERNPTMVDSPSRQMHSQDSNQGVFRPPAAVRPHAMRGHPPHPSQSPYVYGGPSSGSWGYGLPPPPPPHPSSYGGRPYPVPPYNTSTSFDDPGYHPNSQYSPPVTYPGYRSSEEVNVISPNHKGDPHYRPPHAPHTPRSSRNMPPPSYYHYPPTSPVSRHEMMAPGTPGGMSRGRSHPPIRRGGADPSYSRSYQRGDYPHEDGPSWGRYPVAHSPGRPHPQVVTESSFDSEHISRESRSHDGSHPPTPRSSHAHPAPPSSHTSHSHSHAQDPHYQFYGGGGSWGSFDSATGPPPHFDDQRYYGYPADSPYGGYHHHSYTPQDIYRQESFPGGHPGVHPVYHHHPPSHSSYPYSYDEDDRKGYDSKDKKGRPSSKSSSKSNASNMLLPKAAEEVDFDVTDPPAEPATPPSEKPVCESLADVNGYDVLCGRGGGTNSQIGNRRFRKLVQEFQPTYLLARRKEKPLLARSIVLIIRKRGGRFLKKDDDTGVLYEVGDAKAEAKTSQALREGLDVRATKSAASSLLEKKKKQQQEAKEAAEAELDEESPKGARSSSKEPKTPPRGESPPTLPRLQREEEKTNKPNQHSPENYIERKRRRTRPISAPSDRFFPEFCPPRADLARPGSPGMDDDSIALSATPGRRNMARQDSGSYEHPRGCAGIAFDVMTGAATGSFCLGPTGWRR